MATVPTKEPTHARAGDTWQWRREDLSSDYPATAWTLTYYFRNASSYFDVIATADGSTFAVSVALATTADYAPGWYDWTAFVGNGTERYQVGKGRLEVLPDQANSTPYDGRTFARRMLDYIESAMESRASTDQLDLINAQLDARSIARDKAGLVTLRSQFLTEVRREDAAQKGISRNKLLVRFSNG